MMMVMMMMMMRRRRRRMMATTTTATPVVCIAICVGDIVSVWYSIFPFDGTQLTEKRPLDFVPHQEGAAGTIPQRYSPAEPIHNPDSPALICAQEIVPVA